tara:strand:- start:3329 stop:6277 length:2949 start_codon:yes stop_codon:yes gene_type:complete
MANPNAKSEKTAVKKQAEEKASKEQNSLFGDLAPFSIPPGMLNPYYATDNATAFTDPRDTTNSFISLLRKQTKDSQIPNRNDNIGIMRGIVLRVETRDSKGGLSNTFNTLESLLSRDVIQNKKEMKIVSIRARIPEIHKFLPIPDGPDDHMAIKLYPVFTSIDSLVANEAYEVGDIVNLDFENRKERQGGVLLGPLIRAIPQNITNFVCNASYTAAPGGQSLGTSPNALGHTGEKAVPLRARDSRKSVAIIGANGMSGKFGEMVQDYFYSKGYSVLSKKGYSPVETKNNNAGDYRTIQSGLTLPDQVLGTGAGELISVFKERPDILVFQFDELHKTTSESLAQGVDTLKKTIAKLKKESGAQKIFIIGTIKETMSGDSADLGASGGTSFENQGTPNQYWLQKLSQSYVGQGDFIFVDPLENFKQSGNAPPESSMAVHVIDKYIAKRVIDAKGPPPPEPTPSDPEQPYPAGLLEGLLPEIKTGTEAREYLLQVASRLGYNTDATPPTDGSKHWKDLSKRDFSSEPVTSQEMASIVGFGSPPLKPSSEQFQSTPEQATNTEPTAPSTYPDEATAALLKQRLGEQLLAAQTAFKKQVDKPPAPSQAPAPAPAPAACGPTTFGGVTNTVVPGGSTYTGPRQFKKVSLDNAVKSRPGKVKSVLTIHKATVFKGAEGSAWQSVLPSFDAVSLKVMDQARTFTAGKNIEFIQTLQGMGMPVQGWGYHYCRDIIEATNEATAAARICKKLGLKAYWWNAEKHWAGRSGQPVTVDPPGAALQFVHIFKKNAPGVALIFNGFSAKEWSPQNGYPVRSGLPDYLMQAFDGFGPMNYATTPGTVVDKFVKRGSRATALGVPYCPMVGTGRVGLIKNGKPEIWGFANDQGIKNGPKYNKRGSKNADGLLTLAGYTDPKPIWFAYYYGNNTGPIASKGNYVNPPLIKLAAALRAGKPTGIATGTGAKPATSVAAASNLASTPDSPYGMSIEPSTSS